MQNEGSLTQTRVSVDQPGLARTTERKRLRTNLVIFLAVNAALAVSWVALILAGVELHGVLWPWAVVVALWALRLLLEARAVYRRKPERKRYSEERIRREMTRMH